MMHRATTEKRTATDLSHPGSDRCDAVCGEGATRNTCVEATVQHRVRVRGRGGVPVRRLRCCARRASKLVYWNTGNEHNEFASRFVPDLDALYQAIVITNTGWIGENVPCLIYGLRGLIEVEGAPSLLQVPLFVFDYLDMSLTMLAQWKLRDPGAIYTTEQRAV